MTKIVIVTHGKLAEGLKDSVSLFFGNESKKISAIGLFPGESPDELKNKIENEIVRFDDVLIFVDIFAGTPFNVVSMLIDEIKSTKSIECFTGVNLPLIMEAVSSNEIMDFRQLVSHLESASTETIVNVRKVLEI